jgi:hypothetical protein
MNPVPMTPARSRCRGCVIDRRRYAVGPAESTDPRLAGRLERMSRKARELHPVAWAVVGLGVLSLLAVVLWPFLVRTTCIVEGTPIDTPYGPILVEGVGPGTVVWTSGLDGRREPGRVTAVHPSRGRTWLELVLEDGVRLQATARHPIRTSDDWVEAGLLKPGDRVTTRDGPRVVNAVLRRRGDVRVFDLEVEPNPNFFAAGILVHNKSRSDRNAAGTLRTICYAQADFRANDRDGNGIQDYWVADVSGLYTLLDRAGQPIGLIERSASDADSDPRPNWEGTATGPQGPLTPKAGYTFRALRYHEDEQGLRSPYDLGKGRNPLKFGFVAEPIPGLTGVPPTLIVNEGGTIYQKDLRGARMEVFPRNPESQGWTDFYGDR